jgi:hypothetical protein
MGLNWCLISLVEYPLVANMTQKQTLADTVIGSTSFRLMQDVVSTRVLQGLLAAPIVCSIVSLLTVRLTYVVPASLVAGSSILKNLPLGTHWMGDQQLSALFDDELFLMIWRTDAYGWRIFTIDVADSVWEDKGGSKSFMSLPLRCIRRK